MNVVRLLFSVLLAFAASCLPAGRMKVLIIEGASNHDWVHRKEILRAIISAMAASMSMSVTPGAASD